MSFRFLRLGLLAIVAGRLGAYASVFRKATSSGSSQFQVGGLDAGNRSRSSSHTPSLANALSFSDKVPQGEPRIFFLFLTMSGIERTELWHAFFKQQPEKRYRVFLHCKHKHLCNLKLRLHNVLGATQVSTVPSTYCHDLVTPMVELLRWAVIESTNPNDKFVFVSEATLPVKPFPEVYHALTKSSKSDFCIYPTDSWIQVQLARSLRALLVKHSQWVVLNQAHAWTMVNKWDEMKKGLQAATWTIPVYDQSKKGPWGHISNSAGLMTLPGCIDEWAIFGTIFGAFVDDGKSQVGTEDLPGYSGENSLVIRGVPKITASIQGTCRTFAFWDASDFGYSNLIDNIVKDWPESKLTCFPKCESSHPAEFQVLSDRGVFSLRISRYLFARKFPEDVMTLDQFQRFILEKDVDLPPEPPLSDIPDQPALVEDPEMMTINAMKD